MNTQLDPIIEQAIVVAAEKLAAEEAQKQTQEAMANEMEALWLEDALAEIVNQLGDIGQAIRPYMSQPYRLTRGVNDIQVKVSAPGLYYFRITVENYRTDQENKRIWLNSEDQSHYRQFSLSQISDALLYFRTKFEQEAENLREQVGPEAEKVWDYSIIYWETRCANVTHYCPDLAPHYTRQLRERAERIRQQGEQRAADQATYQKWQAECKAVVEQNRAILDQLQAEYNTPYTLFRLEYGKAAIDEEGEQVVDTIYEYVLAPEPDDEGWWLVLDGHAGKILKKRFYNVISIMVKPEQRPSSGLTAFCFSVDDAGEYRNFFVNPHQYAELPAIRQHVHAALLPLPPEPVFEGEEPDDVPF